MLYIYNLYIYLFILLCPHPLKCYVLPVKAHNLSIYLPFYLYIYLYLYATCTFCTKFTILGVPAVPQPGYSGVQPVLPRWELRPCRSHPQLPARRPQGGRRGRLVRKDEKD